MNRKSFIETENRIRSFVPESPLIRSEWLSRVFSGDVYLKLECLNAGNSFKIRGATNALLTGALPSRVITASGGNHGLGVAIACQRMEVPCLVVLPTSTSQHRVELLESWGAEVKLHGEAWDEANEFALNLARDPDIRYIHPFADEDVILGQGTIGVELDKQLEDFDLLVASVGGGGLLTGISLALEALGRKPDYVSVETLGANCLAVSYQAGEIIELDGITSIAKTLGARKTVPFIFEQLSRLVKHVMTVSDESTVEALFQFLEHEKLLVEPATACCIAAMFQQKEIFVGRKTVIIICGSNVTLEEANQWRESLIS